MRVLKNINVKRIIFSSDKGEFIKTTPFEYSTNHISLGNRHLLKHDEKVLSREIINKKISASSLT
tara:strand:- start:260 stop:454 length:195 start_codon:yes stop_codon:yes gene_type:complete